MEKPKVIDFKPYQKTGEIISHNVSSPNNRRLPNDDLASAIDELIHRMREFKPLKVKG